MANPQNLKPPWPKGKSGNPKGRPPKGIAFDDLMLLIDENPGTLREISKIWLARIKAGDYQFFREYLDRSDGKPVPMVESGESDAGDDFGILVRVPTVRQAERMARTRSRKSTKSKSSSPKAPTSSSSKSPEPGR